MSSCVFNMQVTCQPPPQRSSCISCRACSYLSQQMASSFSASRKYHSLCTSTSSCRTSGDALAVPVLCTSTSSPVQVNQPASHCCPLAESQLQLQPQHLMHVYSPLAHLPSCAAPGHSTVRARMLKPPIPGQIATGGWVTKDADVQPVTLMDTGAWGWFARMPANGGPRNASVYTYNCIQVLAGDLKLCMRMMHNAKPGIGTTLCDRVPVNNRSMPQGARVSEDKLKAPTC